MLNTMGDVRRWIRKGAGRSYRDLNGCLLLFISCGLSYLHAIAGLVLFLGRVSWQFVASHLRNHCSENQFAPAAFCSGD